MSKVSGASAKPVALTVAALDPSGGAGIAADLRTFASEGLWGCAVITAITFQSTLGVAGWEPVQPQSIAAQLETLLADVAVGAIKLGMVGTSENCQSVARILKNHNRGKTRLVIDPVLRSSSGTRLGDKGVENALVASLFPLASLVTPNLDEASAIVGRKIRGVDEMADAARLIRDMGPEAVLVTGGHGKGQVLSDVLFYSGEAEIFESRRIENSNTHGTGCVLSAAITAALARGALLREAVIAGRSRVSGAIARGFEIGAGAGPVEPLDNTRSS